MVVIFIDSYRLNWFFVASIHQANSGLGYRQPYGSARGPFFVEFSADLIATGYKSVRNLLHIGTPETALSRSDLISTAI